MRNIVQPGASVESFLQSAPVAGYSMESSLLDPSIGEQISAELEQNGYLVDLVEQEPIVGFYAKGMRTAQALHITLNEAICKIEGVDANYLPFFSVRIFEPGMHATTIHRNHPIIGPWAVGVTLKGAAPFSVYGQDVLPFAQDQTIPLRGDWRDPFPNRSMDASPGSAWALYPTNENQTPHSGGLVHSETRRELLILYAMSTGRYW